MRERWRNTGVVAPSTCWPTAWFTFFEKKKKNAAVGSSLFQPLSTWLLWPPPCFRVGLRACLAAHCASSKVQQQGNKVASSAVSRLRVKRNKKESMGFGCSCSGLRNRFAFAGAFSHTYPAVCPEQTPYPTLTD